MCSFFFPWKKGPGIVSLGSECRENPAVCRSLSAWAVRPHYCPLPLSSALHARGHTSIGSGASGQRGKIHHECCLLQETIGRSSEKLCSLRLYQLLCVAPISDTFLLAAFPPSSTFAPLAWNFLSCSRLINAKFSASYTTLPLYTYFLINLCPLLNFTQ